MIFSTGIKLFIGLALPFAAGYTFLNLLFRKNKFSPAASLALSYGLGMGILAQWMFLAGLLGLKYRLQTIGIPLGILSLFFALLVFKRPGKNYAPFKTNQSLRAEKSALKPPLHKIFYITLGLYILYHLVYVFWRALNIPVYTWDAIATSVFKAKVFFFEESLYHLKNLPHPSYPLQVPLAQTWIALSLGRWDDQLVKIIFPFAFLSFIAIYNYFLNLYANRKWALLGTALLVSSNLFILHGTISYRDFFLLYYNSTAIMLLLLWLNKKEDALLILASLYAGFAAFTKLEGSSYLLVYTVLFFLILRRQKIDSFKTKLAKFLKFTIPCFSICLFYHFYKIAAKIPLQEKTQFDFTRASFSRIPVILKSFAGNIFLSGNWNIIWFLLVISLAVNFTKIKKKIEVRLLLITLLMFFGLYFLNALATANFIWIVGSKSVTTLSRLILHFFPLATLLIVLLNYPEELRGSNNSLLPRKQARNK